MKLLPRRSRSEEERAGSMTLVEHLTELRHRVIVSIWAIAIAMIAAWFLYEPFLSLVREPFCTFITDNPEFAPPTGCDLVFSGPFDAFAVRMKTMLYLGVVIAMPVLLFQLWAFIVPGLTAREKKWSIPFVVASFLLFLAGAVTAFFVLPKSLQFLLGFAGEGVVPLLTVDRYVGFVTLVTLAFGVSFLFPVVLVFLEAVGVIRPDTLAGFRRYAIVVIATIAAVITPGQDVFSMVAMMIPMYLFYEASIIIGRIITKDRETA
ncbi:MAG TPA: twin-arginine translocase subunit TatC [Actinomycetota bacterium]|nr:twin-arginine translocase subunit TatC [Actinomycetota bacterium]